MFVCETKLLFSDLTQDCFRVSDYNIYRIDRPAGNGGGGVAILVLNSLHSEIISNVICNRVECVVCKIKYGTRYLIAACIYRPPTPNLVYSDVIKVKVHFTTLSIL